MKSNERDKTKENTAIAGIVVGAVVMIIFWIMGKKWQ